ncbi:glycosyltransferase family 61 protein [uncultured Helicobacter sp.]|uniref:glycosyltransferase family 61 protein n=1 Tax=uncultured Helicobacter sp. TaxID=175537 RepID=UPI00374E7A1A
MACTQSLNECGGSASVITDKVTPSPRLAQHLNLTHNSRISAASQARDSQIDSESKTLTESTTPHNPNKALPDSNNGCDSTNRAESKVKSLDSAIFAEQKSNKMCSTQVQTASRPLRGAQSLEQGGSSALRNDCARSGNSEALPLIAEKEKRRFIFFGVKGSGEGINPFFFCDTQDSVNLRNIRENEILKNKHAENLSNIESKKNIENLKGQNLDSQKSQESQADPQQSTKETSHTQKNFHFRDIFGNYHRFFRPYTRTLPPLKVRAFAHAYCYSDSSEILITASRKALISQTSYMTHEFAPPPALNTPRKILFILKTCLKWLRFYTTRPQRIDGTLAIMHQSSNYFHYLVESVSSMLQIIHSGLRVDYYVLDTSTPFARGMIEILQIPREKILSPKPHRLLRADSLLLPTLTADVETIEYRDRLLFAHALSLPLNIRDFYASLSTPTSYMSASHTPTSCPTRKVFLTRPMDSNRNIENLQEVQAVFGEFGYEIVLPDNLSLREQIALMRECKIIASMHGAGLANALFAPSGAVVFEIFSEYYHDFGPQMCALLRKHRYMYMVGKTRDTSMHPQQENAYIHPEHLRHALKILEYESN